MGNIFSALGLGLQGLQGGLQQRNDNRLRNEQLAMDKDSQAMQKRQFELQMKRLGLELEQAEYDKELRIARGDPPDIVERENQQRLANLAREAETFALKKRLIQSQIEENQSQADAALYRATGGDGSSSEIDTRFEKVAKLAAQKMEQIDKAIDNAPPGSDVSGLIAERQKIYNEEYEPAIKAQYEQYGVMPSAEPVAEPMAPPNVPAEPANPLDRLINIARQSQGQSQSPQPVQPQRLAGQLPNPLNALEQGASLNPLKGLAGLASLIQSQLSTNPFAPTRQIGNQPGNLVTLDKFTPDMVKRAERQGLVQRYGQPPTDPNYSVIRNWMQLMGLQK